jgi:HAD superfamily hydrolase (TIGR01509 family)
MSLPRPVHAVVFDMDGLLVDTEALYRDALLRQADSIGVHLPDGVFLQMIGTTDSGRILRGHFGPDFDVENFDKGWMAQFHAAAEAGVALKTGVVELLDFLEAERIPCAVCTSSPRSEVDGNLGPHGIRNRFHAVVARGDYARSKPFPDPFLKAAEVLGVDPAHCLALEDSHNGIRAAHAAGMMTVMVPDLLEPTEEMHALCVRVIKSLHDVGALIVASEETA